MTTGIKLSNLLRSAEVIPYDDRSRFVLMSDCHRGGGTWGDNFLKNQNLFFAALTFYYENNYTYIELGDGDELWENRSLKQIIQIHSDAFWILSRFYEEHRLYMLYGNHDLDKKNQRFMRHNCHDYYCESESCRIPLMPGLCVHEALVLEHTNDGNSILLVHGHQGDLLNDTFWKLSRFLVRYFWRPMEILSMNDPTSAAKNYNKKGAVEQRLSKWSEDNSQMLIAGHTHRPMLPIDGDSLYFNCGSCVHPRCITALEISDNQISLVKWSVQTDENLSLYVGRELLAGPVSLSHKGS